MNSYQTIFYDQQQSDVTLSNRKLELSNIASCKNLKKLLKPEEYPKNEAIDLHYLYFPKQSDKKEYFNNKVIRYIFDEPDIEYEPGELTKINATIESFKVKYKYERPRFYIYFKKFAKPDILRFLYCAEFDVTKTCQHIIDNLALIESVNANF